MEYQLRAKEWMLCAGETEREELSALTSSELEDRFYTELAFGTAGLRGVIGAGTNRMNTHVVRRATQGLCDYLLNIEGAKERGVAIAYDSRLYSDAFALETALVCAKNGIRVYLFESLRAVPQLSFALRHLHCIAGVVITASHNPPAYNGYKVYWEHGGQLGPEQASEVLNAIERVGYFDVMPLEKETALKSGLLQMIGKEVDEAYYAATQTLLLNPTLLREKGGTLHIVYTPLHGAGNIPVRTLLSRVGVQNVHVVPAQELPDPAFPTVTAPNPEDPRAFALAIKLADEVGANTILATDPDSDRLGVAVRGVDGAFKVLSGNQIACLLLEYILGALSENGKLPKNAFAAKSIVSTLLADAICAHYRVAIDDVLTGFRFISEKIDEADRTKARVFLFGFEESYGFLAGGFSRDKDAIGAAMLMAELCVNCAAKGKTLFDALNDLYRKYGYYKECGKSYTLTGKEGMERIAFAMHALRENPFASLGGAKTECVEDFRAGTRLFVNTGKNEPLDFPRADMVRYLFGGNAWMAVRPSGTEPKLKCYIGASAATEEAAGVLMQAMLQGLATRMDAYLGLR